MGLYDINAIHGSTLEALADKIREKTGESYSLTPSNMAAEIRAYLEKPSGSRTAVGDGDYDVANAETLIVQNDLDTDDMLFYDWDSEATAMTISVNPSPNYRYSKIDLDKLLADLYIGKAQRGYTTPMLPGMEWLTAWLAQKSIITYRGYTATGKAAAWHFLQRAIRARDFRIREPCGDCGGSGIVDTCPTCSGSGEVTVQTAHPEECPNCGGTGVITGTCAYCAGGGRIGVHDSGGVLIFFPGTSGGGVFGEGHYETCPMCNGTGGEEICEDCGGTGRITVQVGSQEPCGNCDGKGYDSHDSGDGIDCPACEGSGNAPIQMIDPTLRYITLSDGKIIDSSENECGTIQSSYDGDTREITTVYDFDELEGIDYIDFSRATGQRFSIASTELPPGNYRASLRVKYSGDSWSGTWPVSMAVSFSGGPDERADIAVSAGNTVHFTVGTGNSAAKIYLGVKPSDENMQIRVPNGATITQTVTIFLELLEAVQSTSVGKLSDLLRYADSMAPRYAARCMGAYYPLLLLDPAAATAKGYPLDSEDHDISDGAEAEDLSGITMQADCSAWEAADASGSTYMVRSLKTAYAQSKGAVGYHCQAACGDTSGTNYRSYQYDICRKEGSDG